MHIELLWLIPVFAFAGFLFFVARYAQKVETRSKGTDLTREVSLYNSGALEPVKRNDRMTHDERLRELEKAINMLSKSVSDQKPQLNGSSESGELKEKLRSVFKEYDILVSENYSLRAKVKHLLRQSQNHGETPAEPSPAADSLLTRGDASNSKPNLHLYGDTRLMRVIDLEAEEEGRTFDSKGNSAG